MIRRCGFLPLAVFLVGCVSVERTPSPETVDESRWSPAHVTHVQVQAAPMDETFNSQLQLPVVSPDGLHVAAMKLSGQPLALDALFTGKGLDAMSLYVQPVARNGAARQVCPSGAAWPSWSADGKRLAFVVYDPSGRCDIGVYDTTDRTVRRRGGGFKRMSMAAMAPGGDRVAVVVDGPTVGQSQIQVVSMATDAIASCPPQTNTECQLWPHWTPDGRVVYVSIDGDQAWLTQWGPDLFPPEKIARIHVGSDDFALYQALASVGSPLSGDGRRFAYFDVESDRIVLVTLADGESVALAPQSRAGCWFSPRQFVVANADEMRLLTDPNQPGALLMAGLWLPRGGDGGDHLIALTRGNHRRAFTLVRLKIVQD